jgi:hypothetical protein
VRAFVAAVFAIVITAAPAAAQVSTCPNPDGGACLGPLSAGTFTTADFVLPITYTVPDGWDSEEDLLGNFLLLLPGQRLEGVNAGTSDFVGIYHAVAVASENCEELAEYTVGRSPAAIAEYFAGHPGLVTDGPEPVSVGGLDGLRIDVRLSPGWDATCPWLLDVPVVPLIIGDGVDTFLHHVAVGDLVTRLYLLDDGSGTALAIDASYVPQPDQTFEAFIAQVEPVIERLRFATGPVE